MRDEASLVAAPETDAHEPIEIVSMSDLEAEQQLLAYFSLQDTLSKEALAYLSKAVSFLADYQVNVFPEDHNSHLKLDLQS